jgi:hypothetical protein
MDRPMSRLTQVLYVLEHLVVSGGQMLIGKGLELLKLGLLTWTECLSEALANQGHAASVAGLPAGVFLNPIHRPAEHLEGIFLRRELFRFRSASKPSSEIVVDSDGQGHKSRASRRANEEASAAPSE